MATGWDPRTSDDLDGGEWRPVLDVPPPGRQRRWTVLLRWLLLVPQFIVVAVLSLAAFFVTIAGWFSALVLGRLPDPIASFLGSVLAYQTRVLASATLLVDSYPPFSFEAPGHPVRIELRSTPLNRWAVFFRLILMIPASIVASLAQTGWFAIGWVFWLIGIVLGRLPEPVFGATAAVVRYRMRLTAYAMMLTPVYPKGLLGDTPQPAAAQPASATRPLVLGTPAQVLVWLFLLLGLAGHITSGTVRSDSDDYHAASPSPAAATEKGQAAGEDR
ncbi:DUF4389 domain-containing protein [Streptomyces sp. SR27]|uniref:DUF4389 domain-containing protein n=1 Tax=Streptomyces sp. SR27 TaxID=3076630 RepID=UPI00295B88DE|nr:DUF4389 domain-containing protein [Streptomyces sp. SR27]MDV9190613.1 DUF4389 domain-containing protein [Streptomyces sp. SR27]